MKKLTFAILSACSLLATPFLVPTAAHACTLTPLYGSATNAQFAMEAMLKDTSINQGFQISDIQSVNGATVAVTAWSVDKTVCQKFTYETGWRGDCQDHRTVLLKTERCN